METWEEAVQQPWAFGEDRQGKRTGRVARQAQPVRHSLPPGVGLHAALPLLMVCSSAQAY